MKKTVIFIISILFLFSGCATNSIPKKDQKVNLEAIIDNTNMKKFIERIEKIRPSKSSKNYEQKALNYKVFKTLAAKYFTYEQIKPALISEFSKNFTESELLEISNFVQSDVNKKYRKILPKLLKEITEISRFFLTENKNKLSKMIQNRILEIKSKKNLLNILLKNQKKFFIKREHKTYSSLENKSQAEIMFENPAFEELYFSAIEKGINQQIKQKPYMVLYKDIMKKFIEENLSYSETKPYFIKIFRENFTENELYAINKFDTSEAGKKYFKFLPILRKHVQTLFLKMIIEHSTELAPLLKDEKLKKEKSLRTNNTTYINKDLYVAKNIPNLIVVKSIGNIKIKYENGTNFSEHKKAVERLKKYLKETPNLLSKELISRDVKLSDLKKNEKSKYLLIIKPFEYEVKKDGYLKIRIILFDIDKITRNWNSKVTYKEKIKMLNHLSVKSLILKKEFKVKLERNDERVFLHIRGNNNKKIIDDLFVEVANFLANLKLIPNKKIFTKDNIGEKLLKIKCKKSNDISKSLYYKNSNTACFAGVTFTDVKKMHTSSKNSMLNASDHKITFNLDSNICNKLIFNLSMGSKTNDTIDFKETYTQQLERKFKNNCKVNKINGVEFVECLKNKEKYNFLTQSFHHKKRLYKKVFFQMGNSCFDNFKKYYKGNKSDILWRTKYDQNKKENFKEISLFTHSKNNFFNRNYYEVLSYVKEEDGFYLVGKKTFIEKDKPMREVSYFYKSLDEKILNLDNINDKLMDKRLVLVKKVIKTYRKDYSTYSKTIKVN